MSHLSRFDLSFDKPKETLPPLAAASSLDDDLAQLTQDICQLDPELAELVFSASFSTESRDERVARLREWARP